MRSASRLVFLVLAAVSALIAGPAPRADAADGDARKECVCVSAPGSGACQHFLRNPKKPTEDPCWCPKCRDGGDPQRHDGKTVPKGWNATCFADKSEAAYLRRHAAAWGLHCTECLESDFQCKAGGSPCPVCAWSGPSTADFAGRNARKTALERLAREQRNFRDGKAVRLLYDKRFYLVTDVPQLKVQTGPAAFRVLSGHEWAHLMFERAAYARREFHEHFGDPIDIDKPTGMYIPVNRPDGRRLADTHLGNENANVLAGGSDSSRVAEAFCFHGFVISMDQFGNGGDPAIHFAMRHMLGHELVSCWVVVDGHNRALPRWVHEGAAHWLSRLQPRFREDAFACNLEGAELDLSGKGWDKDLRKLAGESKPGAIEVLFAKNAQGQLTADDHRRSWSYLDLCLSEWRAPFVEALRALRKRVPARDAWVQHLGVTPEVFDERWRERILGKRASMDPQRADAAQGGAEALGTRERKALTTEKDPATLAALIRGLGTISDAATARIVVDLVASDHPLVRETAFVALLAIQDAPTLEAAWRHGLAHREPVPRAYGARICAARAIAASVPQLRTQLADSNWYARAEAALALGTLHDADSTSAILKLVDDPAGKTQVAAMDALGMLGEKAERAVGSVAKRLSAGPWQLRVTASQALGEIGSMEGVEPLIARMEVESGRVRHDIQDALKKITRDDLGLEPQHWRTWWEKQKAANGGRIPGRPKDAAPPPPERPDPNAKYAPAKYFGIELFGNRVAFVLDMSGSMLLRFTPSAEDQRRRPKPLRGSNKFEISKSEIAESIRALDPRSKFNVVAFSDDVQAWRKFPEVANRNNVDDAIGWVEGRAATGETNYYDALRTILDLGERLDERPDFADTPDTITFLTDGMPTRGAITDPKTLLAWYSNLNRYSRVTTHVVAFGERGLEIELLRSLAQRNWGSFVHVKGSGE